MNPADEITALKTKRDSLEGQLVVGISEQKEHDINQRIIGIGQEITGWITRLPPVAPPQVTQELEYLSERIRTLEGHGDFFGMDMGIMETSSQRSTPKEVKDEVKVLCKNVCVVTGLKDTQIFPICTSHIVQRKIVNRPELMRIFHLDVKDVDDRKNLVCLTKILEESMDNLDFCFEPAGHGLFKLVWFAEIPEKLKSRVPTIPFFIPDYISRKSLVIQAMDFHRKHGKPMNFDVWRHVDGDGRKSGEQFVETWLQNRPSHIERTTPLEEIRVVEALEVRDIQSAAEDSTVLVLGARVSHVPVDEKCCTCEETKGHLTTGADGNTYCARCIPTKRKKGKPKKGT